MVDRRIVIYSGMLLVAEILVSLFFVAGTYGLIVPLAKPTSTAFVSFYAAGTLADAGTPQLAYDQAQHHAAEERATEAGIEYNFFYYPPVFLLLCGVLGRLPYLAAFLIFEVTTLVLYLLAARAILDEVGWAALIPVLAFPAVFWNFGFGQNAFLTAALFGAGTLYIDRRPALAGLFFGALCYKPHFGLLVPLALAAGGHWRAFVAALISAAALSTLSLVLFGWETWHAFLTATTSSYTVYESGRIKLGAFASPFGAVLLLGGPRTLAYAVQAAATLAAAILVACVWRRNPALPIRAAALASATLVAIPVVLFYDLVLGAVAAAWLVRAGDQSGVGAAEKAALAGLFILTLDPCGVAEAWRVPLAPFIAVALFALVAGRAAALLRGAAPGLCHPKMA